MTKIKATQKKEPTYNIENCNITNTNAPTNEYTRANEYTRDAVVALAKVLEANANALAETARALKGGNVSMECGIRIGT
jgi:hypothetical protein